MKLRTARLCLDCDEVHDHPRCPVCTSETLTYLTRWVPERDRSLRTRPTTSPEAEVYKELVGEDERPRSRRGRRLLKRSVLSLAAVGVVGWLVGGRRARGRDKLGKQPPPSSG
jgi:hypothetical protein